MRTLLTIIFVLAFAQVAAAQSTIINEQGTAGAAVSAGVCSGGATEMFPTSNATTDYALMPEGADIRCEVRGSPDAAANPVPTATVGFLLKSNVLYSETTLNLGAGVTKLGLDCCGVAGAVPVDTWRE